MNSTKLSKPVRKRYRCECGDGDQKMWWVLKFTYKTDPETKRWTAYPAKYQLQYDSRRGSPAIKHCPNCGIRLPEPTETLPEEKKNGRKSRDA